MTAAAAFDKHLAAMRAIATDVAARHAASVDTQARFPLETVAALRDAALLSVAVAPEHGGAGLSTLQMGRLCATLAQACASSAMVYAMHLSQVCSLARHAGSSEFLADYLRQIVRSQLLLASMTSEVGTFGDTRSSICAVQRDGAGFRLAKDATTGSYCASAQGILVTCRRDADAPASDQLLVLVREGDYTLEQTTSWDTLGMRGTVSPGYKLSATGSAGQIIPAPYADIAAQTMMPVTHILWASLWWGIAAEAQNRAAAFVRGQARKSPGSTPPTALLLADLSTQLQTARLHWEGVAAEYDAASPNAMGSLGWGLKINHLKIAMSEATPRLVHQALQIVGILGYKNDSPFSLGRAYRDALSGALMVSNERIAAKNASMLLVFKDE